MQLIVDFSRIFREISDTKTISARRLFRVIRLLNIKILSPFKLDMREPSTPIPLTSCGCCGRNFHPDVVEKHFEICQKNQINASKRKKFDSTKMRAKDTEVEKLLEERRFLPSHMREKPKLPVKKSNWKAKHDDFIRTIRAARGEDTQNSQSQRDAPRMINPDYVQCEYCSRRFNEAAADRHIPFCKEQQNRLKNKGTKEATSSDRMSKRTQYKAPLPKSTPKRAPIPTSKQTKTRPLTDETSEVIIPTHRSDHRFIRNERSRGEQQDLSSTRDITKDKRQQYNKKNVLEERSVRHEARADRKIGNLRYDPLKRDLVSGASITNSESANSIPHNRGHRSQLPTLRKKSHSASSVSSNCSNGSSQRNVPLNDYGTPMAKFCYECGGSYPVPQAKFCCECGTKRI